MKSLTRFKPGQTLTKLGLDLALFLAFLVAMDPGTSGIAVHEWLSLALAATVIFHLLLSWDWIVQAFRRFLKMPRLQQANLVLNSLLFITLTLIMLSGLMISRAVVPFFGLQLPENFSWRSLHSLFGETWVLVIGLHLALNWNWVLSAFKRYLFAPLGKMFGATTKNSQEQA